eukprot:sb/3475757/
MCLISHGTYLCTIPEQGEYVHYPEQWGSMCIMIMGQYISHSTMCCTVYSSQFTLHVEGLYLSVVLYFFPPPPLQYSFRNGLLWNPSSMVLCLMCPRSQISTSAGMWEGTSHKSNSCPVYQGTQ